MDRDTHYDVILKDLFKIVSSNECVQNREF